MTLELWLAAVVVALGGLAMAGSLIGVVFKMGRGFGGIHQRLDTLNGSVADNTKRSIDNAVDIGKLQGQRQQ